MHQSNTSVAGRSQHLVDFVGALREHGTEVGTSDTVDAAAAIVALGDSDRELLRSGLAATLLRRQGQREMFDRIFDLYYPAPGDKARRSAPRIETREQLVRALSIDEVEVADLAADALDAFGGIGHSGSSGFSAYLAMKQLEPDEMVSQVTAAMSTSSSWAQVSTAEIEANRRVAEFRSAVESEARARAAELRGAHHVSRAAVDDAVEERTFLSATARDLAEMRQLAYPLARKLATRVAARRRRAVRGQIDMRRTVRKSMATGGVPMRTVLRARRHGRPDLVVLADMSGSVAEFAEFALLLVQAMQEQFTKVRSFAFIDTCREITGYFSPGELPKHDLAERIRHESGVSRFGSSNYGTAFADFADQYGDVIGPRTALLILGDARTNHTDPNLDAVKLMVRRAKYAYWLNPESVRSWSTGDSAACAYAEVVSMHETRTVRQLADVVGRLLPV